MLQLSSLSATRNVERLRAGAGRRPLALGLALLIEGLLLLALLSISAEKQPGKKEERLTVLDFKADEAAEKEPEPSKPEPTKEVEERPAHPGVAGGGAGEDDHADEGDEHPQGVAAEVGSEQPLHPCPWVAWTAAS